MLFYLFSYIPQAAHAVPFYYVKAMPPLVNTLFIYWHDSCHAPGSSPGGEPPQAICAPRLVARGRTPLRLRRISPIIAGGEILPLLPTAIGGVARSAEGCGEPPRAYLGAVSHRWATEGRFLTNPVQRHSDVRGIWVSSLSTFGQPSVWKTDFMNSPQRAKRSWG